MEVPNHSLPPNPHPTPYHLDLVHVSSPLLEVSVALGLPLKFLLLPRPDSSIPILLLYSMIIAHLGTLC